MKRGREEIFHDIEKFAPNLPRDIMVKLLNELLNSRDTTVADIHNFCTLSNKFKTVCDDREIWDELFRMKFGDNPELQTEYNVNKKYLTHNYTHLYAVMLSEQEKTRESLSFKKNGVCIKFSSASNITPKHGPKCSNYKSLKNVSQIHLNFASANGFELVHDEHFIRFKYLPERIINYVVLFYDMLQDGWLPVEYSLQNVPIYCSICSFANPQNKCAKCDDPICESKCFVKHRCLK